jgi:hypothetical protein
MLGPVTSTATCQSRTRRVTCYDVESTSRAVDSTTPHLSKCVLVVLDVRNHAVAEINDKENCSEPHNPPMLVCSISMPLPAIMTAGCPPYLNPSLSASPMPTGSPSPSPLLLSAPLLNIDQPLKHTRVLSFRSPNISQSITWRVWNPPLQQEFGEDFCKLLITTWSS